MLRNWKILVFSTLLFLIFLPGLVYSQIELPPGLQSIIQYNIEVAYFYLQNLTFPIAFLAGILSFISPCILPILPAFFGYSFKEKRNLTKMTLVFFLGFTLVFMLFGLIASSVGKSFALFQQDTGNLIVFAGIFLVIFGIMSVFGKGFASFIKIKKQSRNDVPGIFLMGMFFAVGWAPCLGPILGGILSIAMVLNNFISAALLLFFYSLGIALPFFILSFLYDRFDLSKNRWIKGKDVTFKISKKTIETHTASIISGIFLIFIGLVFILYQGTNIFITLIGTSLLFYDLQRSLMTSEMLILSNIAGLVILVILIYFLWKFLIRKKGGTNKRI